MYFLICCSSVDIGIKKTVLKNKMQAYDNEAIGADKMSNMPRIKNIRPAGKDNINTRSAKPEFLSMPRNSSC